MKNERMVAVITGKRCCVLEKQPFSCEKLNDYEVLVQTTATAISPGTELGCYGALDPAVASGKAWNSYPWQPGYSAVGKILAMGAKVSGYQIGQRVVWAGTHASCGITDVQKDPRFAAIPDGVSDTDASIHYMAAISSGIVHSAGCKGGEVIALFGLGVIGNMAGQFLLGTGAKVVAFDPVAKRRAIGRQCGLTVPETTTPQAFIEELKAMTNGKGPNIGIDAVGNSAIIEQIVNIMPSLGTVIMLGTPKVAYETNITNLLLAIHRRPLTLCSSRINCVPDFAGHESAYLSMLLEKIRDGKLKIAPIITHRIKPYEIGKAYDGLLDDKENYLGAIVNWC